ncbi:MAG: glycosyltransferase family 2 protein [Bacteroidia bacterium]|nr:glycosyltransferase family 2 protein [Bacteroidia bacterium]MBT8279470.1 glycosyltransferase family 2 protein [Bacteroidia bacterium]NND24944.1 glycosyltransferase family 2 protein [Flavobacteriaceae bacterium]NNK61295.1 glycosyltransferase family 2 protein [Flavobacteriaceae bacterium]NNL31738.1 glycosyltransferase family 2 protein [Flavobacteriaceae bacterium]
MFNIITPTYNRENLITRVFDSLVNQTYQEFKWIIVDDASTDNTKDLVESWQRESNLSIQYYYLNENKGKPHAVNFGLSKCEEKYTIIADSDDTFSPNTLEDLLKIWKSINVSEMNICAIWSLVIDEDNNIKGDKFPVDKWQVDFKERVLFRKHQLQGDKWHCWITEILKQYPLYEDDHCHIGESHTWNRINKSYNFLCINSVFLKAHRTENSLITSKKSRKEVARALYLSSFHGLKDVSPLQLLKYKYYRYLAFEYIKSKFHYASSELKLSNLKLLLSWFIFIYQLPFRFLKKLI